MTSNTSPITTAREALKSLLKSLECKWGTLPNTAFVPEMHITAALDYAEKLKAEADPEALVIAHAHGAQMATEKHRAEIARLTSQLEQAEKAMEPFADENEAQTEERPSSVKDIARPHMFYRATYADLSALSQWIKDRQAKTDAAIGDK